MNHPKPERYSRGQLLRAGRRASYLRMLFGGVVDRNVQLAQFTEGHFDGFAAGVFITHIARSQYAAAALRLHQTAGFLRVVVFVQVHDGDVRTLLWRKRWRPRVPGRRRRR